MDDDARRTATDDIYSRALILIAKLRALTDELERLFLAEDDDAYNDARGVDGGTAGGDQPT